MLRALLPCSVHLLADPTSFEEPLLDATLTVLVDEKSQIVSILQEGASFALDIPKKCTQAAKRRRGEITI